MKRYILKAPAFVCMAVYLVMGWKSVSAMVAATTRNFYIVSAIPSLLGAVLFLVYGFTVSEKKSARSSFRIGLANMVISLLPFILLALLLSPWILCVIPLESWKNCIVPMLMSLYPFAVALWSKVTRAYLLEEEQ